MESKIKRYKVNELELVADSQNKAIYLYKVFSGQLEDITFMQYLDFPAEEKIKGVKVWELISCDEIVVGWACGETEKESIINEVEYLSFWVDRLKGRVIEELKK